MFKYAVIHLSLGGTIIGRQKVSAESAMDAARLAAVASPTTTVVQTSLDDGMGRYEVRGFGDFIVVGPLA